MGQVRPADGSAAPSGELVRDGPQRILIGQANEWGTGWLPKTSILETTRAMGVRDLVDTVTVKHVSGGASRIKFKTYDQGRLRWQAETLDWVYFDEEPPEDIYSEGPDPHERNRRHRVAAFTPLLGMSEVVRRFLTEEAPDRSDTNFTIEDAEHIPAEQRARIIASYPAHEREARTEARRSWAAAHLPDCGRRHRLCDALRNPVALGADRSGLDFGWDHPTARREAGVGPRRGHGLRRPMHTGMREATPVIHAGTLRGWGIGCLGMAARRAATTRPRREAGDAIYRTQGLNMLPEHAVRTTAAASRRA